jgi:hypothetical protein
MKPITTTPPLSKLVTGYVRATYYHVQKYFLFQSSTQFFYSSGRSSKKITIACILLVGFDNIKKRINSLRAIAILLNPGWLGAGLPACRT